MTQKKAGGRTPSTASNETRRTRPTAKSASKPSFKTASSGGARASTRSASSTRPTYGEAPKRTPSRAATSLSASPTYGKKRPASDFEPRSESRSDARPAARSEPRSDGRPAKRPVAAAPRSEPSGTVHAKPRKTDRTSPRAPEEAPGGRRGRVPAERPHRTTDAKKKPSRSVSAFGASSRPSSRTGAGPSSRMGASAASRSGKPAASRSAALARGKPRREREAAPAPVPRPMEWNEVRHIKVDANSDGQRIDNFLMKHLPGVPKSAVYRLVRSGQVRVDGGRAKPERKLVAAESVRIPPVRLQDPAEAVRPPDRVLNELRESVIHEDANYLVINKPEGLSSHGGTGQLYGVIEAIRAWEKYEFIELCHRLDRDTSGVLLLAKSRKALLRAQQAFKNHEITKR